MGGSFMRSRTDRRIAGICGGIAQTQGWDSTMIRLVWLLLVCFAGTGLLAYIVLWIVIPEEPYGLPPHAGYAPPVYPYGQQPQAPGTYPGGQTYQGPTGPQKG